MIDASAMLQQTAYTEQQMKLFFFFIFLVCALRLAFSLSRAGSSEEATTCAKHPQCFLQRALVSKCTENQTARSPLGPCIAHGAVRTGAPEDGEHGELSRCVSVKACTACGGRLHFSAVIISARRDIQTMQGYFWPRYQQSFPFQHADALK